MMNQKVKAKWVAALRSGTYRQGHQMLVQRRYNRLEYCCLGVLYLVTGRKVVNNTVWPRHASRDPDIGDIERTTPIFKDAPTNKILDESVIKASGLQSLDPEVAVPRYGEHSRSTLSLLNDGRSSITDDLLTFSRIADIIEADKEL